MRHPVALTVTLSSIVLSWCACALALDPSLDLSQYAHTSWRNAEGFTKGAITAIVQTPDGYLWLGTELGLVRFDGVRAVPWQPPAGEQLPSNLIRSLLVAHDGTLWIGTLKGLASWKDGKLTQYPEVAGGIAFSLLQDHEGTVWVPAQTPGRLCAIQGAKVQCYGAGSFGRWVSTICEDLKGSLWVAAETGLWRWKPGRPKQYKFPGGVSDTSTSALIEGEGGSLLISTVNGVKQLASGKIKNYALPGVTEQFRPYTFFRSPGGSLWIGSYQGLLRLRQGRTNKFTAIDGLSDNVVHSIFEDREGNVWVGTMNGLDRFREPSFPTISRDQGLSTSMVYSIQVTPNGSVWMGTSDRLNRWENGHVTFYGNPSALDQSGQKNQEELIGNAASKQIVNSGLAGTVASLGQDDRGRLWVSTTAGVFYFESGRFIRVPDVPGTSVWSMVGDGHGGMWISNGTVGLFHWAPSDLLQSIPWSRFGRNYGARALLPDGSSGLWLGLYEGGVSYFKDGQVRASYTSANGLSVGRVNHLRFGSKGAVWAATEGGLSRIKDGHIETLSSSNGLPCEEVHWSMEDDDHALWVYMPCGLARIERSEWYAWVEDPSHVIKRTIFDSFDGVRSIGVYGSYGPHVAKTPDGKLWFLSWDGISVIDPHHIAFNNVAPPVHIERITADGKTYDTSNGLPLPPHVRDVSIDYTALSLVAPEKVHFRYKLEGQDPNWKEVVNERKVQYSNLAPRHYTFRVMACNNSGVWNEAGASLEFSVLPAFYQTNWFRILCGFGFLTLLWSIYRLRIQHLQRQFNIALDARVNERTRIARELHDTLLQSLHGLLLSFQRAANLLPDRPVEAKERLEGAIDQAALAITEGRDAVQGLRSSTVLTNDLPVAIQTLGEELAAKEDRQNSPVFDVAVEGTPRDLNPILRDDVYRIAGEAVRNAFRHAQAGRIEVEIRYDDYQLRVRIRDDGKGVDAGVLSNKGRSGHWGLPGMRERAKLVGGQLEIWSELDSGTEMELTIPASIAYLTSVSRQSKKRTA